MIMKESLLKQEAWEKKETTATGEGDGNGDGEENGGEG